MSFVFYEVIFVLPRACLETFCFLHGSIPYISQWTVVNRIVSKHHTIMYCVEHRTVMLRATWKSSWDVRFLLRKVNTTISQQTQDFLQWHISYISIVLAHRGSWDIFHLSKMFHLSITKVLCTTDGKRPTRFAHHAKTI
jgi:hypothetical protein